MPNHRSAEKRVRADKKRQVHNITIKSSLKTLRTNVLKTKTKEEAQKNLLVAISAFHKAAGKKIIHKNTASRKISRMVKKVNALA